MCWNSMRYEFQISIWNKWIIDDCEIQRSRQLSHDWMAFENNTINKTLEQHRHLSLDSSPKSDCFLSQVAVLDCEIDRSESRVISDLGEH